MDKLKKIWMRLQFNKKQQQIFLEDFLSLINDGVNTREAVTTIETISQGVSKQVAHSINLALAKGQGIAQGLNEWFPPTIVEVIRAGENSGALNSALASAIDSIKRQTNVMRGIVISITYPMLVLILALIMVVIIKNTVLENFASIKPLTQWPAAGLSLYRFAQFIEYWGWLTLCVIILAVVFIYKFLTQYTGEWRHEVDKIPLLALYRDSMAARFMQTLGILINNGMIMKRALSVISNNAGPYLNWHIMQMEYRLSGGTENIADVLDTHLLREHDLVRLKVVVKGKGFAPALMSLGDQAAKRNERLAIFTAKILGGIILVLGAMIAANIIFGIYSVGSILAS